jgi:hypothetical protein
MLGLKPSADDPTVPFSGLECTPCRAETAWCHLKVLGHGPARKAKWERITAPLPEKGLQIWRSFAIDGQGSCSDFAIDCFKSVISAHALRWWGEVVPAARLSTEDERCVYYHVVFC